MVCSECCEQTLLDGEAEDEGVGSEGEVLGLSVVKSCFLTLSVGRVSVTCTKAAHGKEREKPLSKKSHGDARRESVEQPWELVL